MIIWRTQDQGVLGSNPDSELISSGYFRSEPSRHKSDDIGLGGIVLPGIVPLASCSAQQSRLGEPRTYKKYEERAFSVAGPKLWNDLPHHTKKSKTVDSFKSQLKTYLFINKAYGMKMQYVCALDYEYIARVLPFM